MNKEKQNFNINSKNIEKCLEEYSRNFSSKVFNEVVKEKKLIKKNK